jgi:hypothetical protein
MGGHGVDYIFGVGWKKWIAEKTGEWILAC